MAASHDQKLIGGWSGGDGFGRHHLPFPQARTYYWSSNFSHISVGVVEFVCWCVIASWPLAVILETRVVMWEICRGEWG
jgi:hypothetical protein